MKLRSLSCTYAYDQSCELTPILLHLESNALPAQPHAPVWEHIWVTYCQWPHDIFYVKQLTSKTQCMYAWFAETSQSILSGSFCSGNNLCQNTMYTILAVAQRYVTKYCWETHQLHHGPLHIQEWLITTHNWNWLSVLDSLTFHKLCNMLDKLVKEKIHFRVLYFVQNKLDINWTYNIL